MALTMQRPQRLTTHATRSRRSAVKVLAYAFDVTVRPYTLRKGDTISSIVDKRGFTIDQVVSINHDVKVDAVKEGDTILLPAGSLSSRDKEILGGIGASYRVYPVRKGEKLSDILSKREISEAEFKELNPGIDGNKIKENQLLKLPSDKFTVREREMLIGQGILPQEFFEATRNPFAIGIGALLMVCGFVLAWQKFYKEDEDDEEDLPAEPTKASS